jgi:hypothetical protein
LTVWQPVREENVLSARELKSLPGPREDEPLGIAHRRQLEEILTALRGGREPPVPGEEARKAVEINLGSTGPRPAGSTLPSPSTPKWT